jgi:hypothetical protein
VALEVSRIWDEAAISGSGAGAEKVMTADSAPKQDGDPARAALRHERRKPAAADFQEVHRARARPRILATN